MSEILYEDIEEFEGVTPVSKGNSNLTLVLLILLAAAVAYIMYLKSIEPK